MLNFNFYNIGNKGYHLSCSIVPAEVMLTDCIQVNSKRLITRNLKMWPFKKHRKRQQKLSKCDHNDNQ